MQNFAYFFLNNQYIFKAEIFHFLSIYSRVIQGVVSWYSGGVVGCATLIRGTTP